MTGCCAVGCTNRDSKGFLMKRFPRDPERRKQWEVKVSRANWKPTSSSYLCEMTGCCAVGCTNRDSKGFLMKRFPRDPERRKQWEVKVSRANWKPTSSSYLCEKKALQNLKAPRQEPERTTPIKRPQIEARDAREIAKKLIKSGAIAAIQKAPKRDEKSGFKRPGGLERKLERSLPGYQPFSATLQEEDEPKIRSKPDVYDPIAPMPNRRDDTLRTEKPIHPSTPTETKTGNTVFVIGYNITKELLEKTFSQYGTIINITMEADKGDKGRGFVTFGDTSSAEGAIRELDGSVVGGQSKLKVTYARRQPFIQQPPTDSPASKVGSTWQAAANNHVQKSSNNEGRVPVTYDDVW